MHFRDRFMSLIGWGPAKTRLHPSSDWFESKFHATTVSWEEYSCRKCSFKLAGVPSDLPLVMEIHAMRHEMMGECL